jgi:hypothetical protein
MPSYVDNFKQKLLDANNVAECVQFVLYDLQISG